MSLLREIRQFWRVFRASRDSQPRPGQDSLARTLRDSTHVRGAFGGISRSGTEAQHEIVAKSHQDYVRSFEDDRDAR